MLSCTISAGRNLCDLVPVLHAVLHDCNLCDSAPVVHAALQLSCMLSCTCRASVLAPVLAPVLHAVLHAVLQLSWRTCRASSSVCVSRPS